jgi:predicted DNA-binding ribbon-helix-helix protein
MTAKLPERNGEWYYRVHHTIEQHERIAREGELMAIAAKGRRTGRGREAVNRQPKLASLNVKRSVAINGRKTSVGLEAAFWLSFKDIAAREGVSVSALATRIDADREHKNSSSVIRLFVLEHYHRLAEAHAAGDVKAKSDGAD